MSFPKEVKVSEIYCHRLQHMYSLNISKLIEVDLWRTVLTKDHPNTIANIVDKNFNPKQQRTTSMPLPKLI